MKFLLLLPVLCFFASCSSSLEPLVVKQHTLRDQDISVQDDPMVRHEKMRRLYGAISMEERRQLLGQYYTILWNADPSTKKEVLFEYQQGKTGSLIKTTRREIASGTPSGKEEFSVIGDNYFENGRVLTWRISLISDGETIATKKSYLWD